MASSCLCHSPFRVAGCRLKLGLFSTHHGFWSIGNISTRWINPDASPRASERGKEVRSLGSRTRAFHKARGRRAHFWERRYRACLVEENTYALAALRSLDRNPVRAGLVGDPTTYPWSSCAAYALGTPNQVITFHPSYPALSPYGKVRRRHYATLLVASEDPRADARDPRWTTQRAVGSPAFLERHLPRGGRRKSVFVPSQIQGLGD